MDPLTILTLTIGTAIAKAMVIGWLKDYTVFGQITADLLDLLRDTIKPQAEKERTAEHIEAIGRRIADRMRPHFDQEVAAHPYLNYEAVVWEVATTLQKARISVDLIVQCRVDHQKLAKHLIASRRKLLKTLSDDETHLYRQMLTLASQEIMNTADELTGFVPAAFAASLEGQDRIFKAVASLLARPSEEMERFETAYRHAIVPVLDKVDIFGIRYADRLTQSQSLSLAYIPLQAEQSADRATRLFSRSEFADTTELTAVRMPGFERLLEESAAESPKSLRRKTFRVPLDLLRESSTQPIEHILAQSPRLVVRGDAGSGKTTLLKWIAVRAANQDFPDHLAACNKLVPFFIRLRERVNKGFPPPEEFPGLVVPVMAGSMPRGCIHNLLDNGRALVLIDGVDELPHQQREQMLAALDQLVTTYPLAHYIITSRPSALKAAEWPEWEQWTRKKEFATATLQPMRPAEIETLIEQWHTALSQATGAPASEMSGLAANLKRIVRRRPPLGRLATSPLLCAMLCALHHERGGHNLPAERIRLYSDCVEMLLERRDEARHIPLGADYPDLGYDEKLELIRHFAYWMMRNDYAEVDVAQADECFDAYLAKTVRAGLQGDRVRRFFVDRASLLREPVADRIDFTHRTIQEFLTAQAIFAADDFGFLLGKVRDDQWRETIILTSGYTGTERPAERTRFLRNLIARGDRFKTARYQHQVHLLAVACLEGNAGLEKEAQEYVLQQAAAIFPPKDGDEAKLVASAGDPAIPLLAANPAHSEEEAAMCVRALALIGSQAALEALVGYTGDERDQILRELGRAWEAFERHTYLRQVLIHCKALHLSDNASLLGLEQLTHLSSLTVTSSDQFSDLNLLAPLVNLTELNISETHVSNLNPLAQLSQLTVLHIHEAPVNDLGPLAQLSQLVKLSISEMPVSDLGPLAQLSQLVELYIGEMPVSDLSPLAQLSQLTELYLSETQVSDLNSLAQLSQLTVLHIDQAPVSDLSPLAQLSQLTDLYIDQTLVSDLSPLAQLAQLATLEISQTQVSDLNVLAKLSQLTNLYISETHVSDLSFLTSLSPLTTLYLREMHLSDLNFLAPLSQLTRLYLLGLGAQVSDLSPLARLSQLTELYIGEMQVSDLSPLAQLSQLTTLYILETPVTDLSPLAQLPQLTTLYIRGTQVSDLSPIEGLTSLTVFQW
jgi:Leucine-rich repeat (LRR) protein